MGKNIKIETIDVKHDGEGDDFTITFHATTE